MFIKTLSVDIVHFQCYLALTIWIQEENGVNRGEKKENKHLQVWKPLIKLGDSGKYWEKVRVRSGNLWLDHADHILAYWSYASCEGYPRYACW